MTPLVLASASPRRADLLTVAGIPHEVRPTRTDEAVRAGEAPEAYVVRVATDKALAAVRAGEVGLGADTTVVLDGEILGKPVDAADAARMLRLLSGRIHAVLTAVVLCDRRGEPPDVRHAVCRTEVEFGPLDDATIAWYVATGEPLDKAGAYALQGAAGLFVRRIDGSPSNVIGLPLHVVARLLAGAGWPVHGGGSPAGQ